MQNLKAARSVIKGNNWLHYTSLISIKKELCMHSSKPLWNCKALKLGGGDMHAAPGLLANEVVEVGDQV